MRAKVSVIIPVYNGGRYLGAALRSVFRQDYGPTEIIVVNDGSSDNSAEVAVSFKDIIYFYQENRGVAAARNTGIAAATGEFIAFLDADDIWRKNKLTLQIDWLLNHPQIGYVTAKFRNLLEKGIDQPKWLKHEHLIEDQVGGMPNLVVRKSVFQRTGLFDTGCRSGSDLEWVLRAKDAGIRGDTLPYTLLYRRIHGANLSYQWRGGRDLLLKSLRESIGRRRCSIGK